MIIEELNGSLFSAPRDVCFVHFISGDYVPDAGLGRQFEQRYGLQRKLTAMYPIPQRVDVRAMVRETSLGRYPKTIYKASSYRNYFGKALLVGNVFCLVVKEESWQGTTWQAVKAALFDLHRQCASHRVKHLAISAQCCGANGPRWDIVKSMLEKEFQNTEVKISVYSERAGKTIHKTTEEA